MVHEITVGCRLVPVLMKTAPCLVVCIHMVYTGKWDHNYHVIGIVTNAHTVHQQGSGRWRKLQLIDSFTLLIRNIQLTNIVWIGSNKVKFWRNYIFNVRNLSRGGKKKILASSISLFFNSSTHYSTYILLQDFSSSSLFPLN